MRLRRLDLIRYGHFTNYTLDLGSKPAHTPDFHLIYGPNEAGKSTVFDGYLDFLFGIPSRSNYNFLHDYNSMRLGACLELDNGPLELLRIKKMRNDLLDAQENPANATVLNQALGGLNRDEYRAMFSLDDVTIEAGGNEILSSKGNLGELLFSAASGLSELGNILTEARAEADLFHKKAAKKTHLAEARRELKLLSQALKDIDMDAGRYKKLQKALNLAQNQHDTAKSACDRLRLEKENIAGLLACLPQWQQRSDLMQQLSELPELTGFDAAWVTQAQELQTRTAAHAARTAAVQEAMADITAQKAAVKTDDAMISAQQLLEDLLDAPYARAQTAAQDLPRREQEKMALEQELTRLLGQVGLQVDQAKTLTAAKLETLGRLARNWEAAQAQLEAAKQETITAQHDVDLAVGGMKNGDVDNAEMPLHVVLEHWNPEDLVSQWQRVCSEETAKKQELDAMMPELLPWQGAADQVPQNAPSDSQAARLVDELEKAQQAVNLADARVAQTVAARAKLTARIAALRDQGRVQDAESLRSALQQRDNLWQQHLHQLTLPSAQKFAQAMTESDTLQEIRLQMAEKMALLREWQLELASLEADLAAEKMALETQKKHAEKRKVEALRTLQAIGLPDGFDVLNFPDWLKARTQIQALQVGLQNLQQEKNKLAKQLNEAVTALSGAFDAPKNCDLRLLARLAREKVTEFAQHKEAQKAVVIAQKRLELRQVNQQECAARLEQVQAQWQADTTAQILGFDPVAFTDADASLRGLVQKQQDVSKLLTRISAMQMDANQFAHEIKGLDRSLAGSGGTSALATARELQARLVAARAGLNQIQTLNSQLAEQKRLLKQAATEQTELDLLTQDLGHLLGQGGATLDAAALVGMATQAQSAATLRADIVRIEGQVFLRLGLKSVAAVQEVLQDCDTATLRARLEGVAADLIEKSQQHVQTIGDLRSAADALAAVGGDDAAARLQGKRQFILLDLEEKAKQSLRLRLGAMVAHEALIQYRDSHRSSMLAQTEQAFVALTDGRYKALQTQSDGETETLLAIQAVDNRAKLAQDMSKGTRFQLYLALRVAGYKQFSESGLTLPFVADDIFETFDDTRTAAALKLLSEMGKTGQALYFTHHKHVVDLARQGLGDACQIHELPTR